MARRKKCVAMREVARSKNMQNRDTCCMQRAFPRMQLFFGPFGLFGFEPRTLITTKRPPNGGLLLLVENTGLEPVTS